MGKRAPVSARSSFQANGIGLFDPFLDANLVTVQTCLIFNYGEFAIIKSGIENGLPNAEKLDGVAIAEPVGDEKLAILGPQHVRERNVVALSIGYDCDSRSLDVDG